MYAKKHSFALMFFFFFLVTIKVATRNWNMCDVTEGKLDNLLYAVVKLLVAEISFRFIHTKFLIGNCTSYSCAKLKMKFKMEKVVMDAVVANWCFRNNIVKDRRDLQTTNIELFHLPSVG